jgi:hypothetical protein
MSIYKVKRDYERGMWVKDHPDPVVEVAQLVPMKPRRSSSAKNFVGKVAESNIARRYGR